MRSGISVTFVSRASVEGWSLQRFSELTKNFVLLPNLAASSPYKGVRSPRPLALPVGTQQSAERWVQITNDQGSYMSVALQISQSSDSFHG